MKVEGRLGHDACKEQNGNAVSDALLVDLLAHPHHQSRAGCEGENNDEGYKNAGTTVSVKDNVLSIHAAVAQVEIVRRALNKTQDNGNIPGDGSNLFAALFPFLGHSLQRPDSHRQQLHNNGAVDIGANTHGKERSIGESTAGKHIQIAQGCAVIVAHNGIHQSPQRLRIQEGNRDYRTKPETR